MRTDRIVQSKVVCPKCKSKNLELVEIWAAHTIVWQQTDGSFNRDDGNLEPGEAVKVEAECECGHKWKIRGASQITDIIKHL